MDILIRKPKSKSLLFIQIFHDNHLLFSPDSSHHPKRRQLMDETFLLVKSLTKRFKSASGVFSDQLIPCHKSLRSLTGACNLSRFRCQVPCASCQVHLKWDLYKSPPPTYGQVGGSYMRCVRRKPKKCHHVLLVCGIITLTTLQCLRLSHQFLILSWGEIFAKLVFCSRKGTRESRKNALCYEKF